MSAQGLIATIACTMLAVLGGIRDADHDRDGMPMLVAGVLGLVLLAVLP